MPELTRGDNLPTVSGIALLDKPVGPTSFRMVQLVRRALQVKKVGHAGTLDPFASGLLIVCVGRPATRQVNNLMTGEKVYAASLQLGIETDTQDRTGAVTSKSAVSEMSHSQVLDILGSFEGKQMQRPPSYSALKYKGKPLYYYARRGETVVKEPREVFIKSISLVSLEKDILQIEVVCSKGTYIRSLASDIGAALGCGAHLQGLRRLRSGKFSVAESLSGKKLEEDRKSVRELLIANMLPVETVSAGV